MKARTFIQKISLATASSFCMLGALLAVPPQVLADDTEVFFPTGGGGEDVVVRPNIMFILDTSGSMVGNNSIDGSNPPKTRLERMKDAFGTIISGLSSEVNVGLMKFSGAQGGPVLFPVAHIDAYVDDVDLNASGDRAFLVPVTETDSEANQQVGGTTTIPTGTLNLRGGSASSYNSRIALKFLNIPVPKGVTISSANIQFRVASSSNSTALGATISIENTGDAASYVAATNNISNRPLAAPVVSWTNVGLKNGNSGALATTTDEDYTTPDIASLLNAVISRADWCGGNSVSIIIQVASGTGQRYMASYASDTTLAPILNLAFDPFDPANKAALSGPTAGCSNTKLASQVSTNNDDAFQHSSTVETGCGPIYLNSTPSSNPSCGTRRRSATSGLRFQNLNIKKNANVVSAVLQVVAQGASSATPNLTIKAEKGNNPVAYTSGNNNLTNRDTGANTTASVTRSTTAWSSGQKIQFDVTNVVRDVVAQSNWEPNDPISILITGDSQSTSGSDRSKPIYSRESGAGNAAKLLVTVQGPADRIKVREYLQQLVNEFNGAGGTPTMGALYEAARYFRGEDAFYGLTRSGGDNITQTEVNGLNNPAGVVASLRISGRATFDYSVSNTAPPDRPPGCTALNLGSTDCEMEKWTGVRKYKSPITDGCQSNNIILLSDGDPNNGGMRSGSDGPVNKSAEELIGAMIGSNSCVGTASNSSNGSTRTLCGPELANFLYSKDQVPDTILKGDQVIKTHTIAFGSDVGPSSTGGAFLRSLSIGTPAGTGGGGQFFTATSTDEVTAAFDAIISEILDVGTTFVAPAVTVNTFNRLTTRNELYYALFTPSGGVNWAGNLKRYELKQLTAAGVPQIYDQNGSLAVDPATGFFTANSCSFWTDCSKKDGADVEKGGAASKLTTSRKVYTSLAGSNLTAPANLVSEVNVGAFSNATLGLNAAATQTDREELLQWARGMDVNDDNGNNIVNEARLSIGDPLHSEPTLISYGGTDISPELAIFYGDNQGYLHAVDAASGSEYFSYVPPELLRNLNVYYQGDGTHGSRPYGMDGPIVSYVKDTTKLLYAGMRRGGRSYYALNVADRNNPQLKFQIQGGAGGYQELGQTWSRPILANIRIAGTNRLVMIFSGGYDPAQDTKTDLFTGSTRTADGVGRGVFVADALTGALLWWAGNNGLATPNLNFTTGGVQDMVYSIAATPAAIDLDGDGLTDRIYLADTGGQVFRIVLGKDAGGIPSLSNATGSMIAKLSVPGVAGSRHFFNAPDVSLITQSVSAPFVAISIGTGHRERPLDTATSDRFYVLKDPDITNDSPSNLLISGDADLYDATANLAGSTDPVVAQTAKEAIAAKKGLYIRLGAAEKSLTTSTTFNNQVIFATFSPSASSDECKATAGESRFYQINISDGTPVQNFDGVGSTTVLTASDRSKKIKIAGLPPNPVVLFPSIRVVKNPDGTTASVCNGPGCTEGELVKPPICVGVVCVDPQFPNNPIKTYWRTQ